MVELTPREKEVLTLVGKIGSAKEIANELGIEFRTVHFHSYNIRNKFRTGSISVALGQAIKLGIIKAEDL